ncbi:Acetylornithine deacetylase/Succinyl-diaminopimelate desuccinylase [Cryptosporangium aurantiacum]|uniref:Acetylornithine deacetylase/Succinyl-diaminopimelate desuccinylase n=1 Tax=Cryptosporangium aurantiacum TaxID=134849 RepID=A0A1M7KC76_9ACTN|nr:Acetylornithine deacetylase/Succinyl-diaminopimelate desuccinylase [Cryptosporangium aurantiacum]
MPSAVDEVVALTSALIRIDTSNTGDPDAQGTERPAAEYVAGLLSDAGYEPTYVESGPGRGNVVVRLPGADPGRGALLVHGHLDVVPADPAEWAVHPFSGEVRDGYVWGRGAVDMKGMVAMALAVARQFRRERTVPPRDVIFAFLADEEAGGRLGAQWLVDHRPELFDGATEAISEVGGYSVTLGGTRAYLIQVAEKTSFALRLAAHGTPGHGAMLHEDNPVARLAEAVARLDRHRFPVLLTDPMRQFLTGAGELLGAPFDSDDPEATVARLGPLARLIGAGLRDTANVTMLSAGYKSNVVPSVARAEVDCRVLPGRLAAFEHELVDVLGPGIEAEWRHLPAWETTFDGPLVDAMTRAVTAEDPGARLLPYLLPAATDAKAFARLGVRTFGFAPLRLPPDLDFSALFHGVDERVPVDALEFGVRVLERFLLSS